MDHCPPEIQIKIFALACIDGGRTGCALSRVSRHIRATSSPVRFYTISLHGILRMRLFLEIARQRFSCPKVTHLFLYDGGREGLPYFGENALAVIISIVSMLSPFLRTLSGSLKSVGATYSSLFPPGTDLSSLQELSLDVHPMHESNAVLPNLPALRLLHKWGKIRGRRGILDVDAVVGVAPKLAHIRFSGLDQARVFPVMLGTALKHDFPGSEGVPKLRLPDCLEQILIQCVFVDDRGWCGTDSMIYCDIQVKLSILAAAHEKVVILPESDYTVEDCMVDWLEIAEGGEGWRRNPPRKLASTLVHERDPEGQPKQRDRSIPREIGHKLLAIR